MTAPFMPVGNPEPLPNNAKAPEQMARLLDALLILDVERSCPVAELAERVGLQQQRLRDLLSSYMVAGADVVGTAAAFTITFGTADGPLSADPEDDSAQAAADVVYVSDTHANAPLLDDLGRRAVPVEDVARGLLSARAVLASGALEERQRVLLDSLVTKLEAAMHVTVTSPISSVIEQLLAAAVARRRVSFRYRDPWTGQESHPYVEPYAVRRRRDRYFLEAGEGAEVWTYDLSAITDLAVDALSSFPQRSLPSESQRDLPLRVVLRVPMDSGAERRLCQAWDARVVGPVGDGQLDLAIELERANAASRLGVLVLQLGPPCTVVEPAELVDAAVPVAQRLLEGLPSARHGE